MYSIFADNTAFEGGTNVCIYNDVTPLKTCKLINPKLVMEDSAAGSLEFVLPPGNAGYDLINPMTTDLVVYRDDEDEEIWRGRALSIDIDFYKRKRIYCEGELAFLNDTIQPPAKYSASAGTTVSSFLEALINIHNQNVSDNRKFQVGIVTVTDGDTTTSENVIYRYTNYESTLKCINEKLVERLGGHLRTRHQNGVRLLDYLKDDDPVLDVAADQIIQFGKNLLDYTQNFTMDELATVIVPRGARLETETIEGLEDYLTVKSVNRGSIYVESEEAVNTYGRIIAVVDWDNVTDANNLLNKARQYLAKEQFDKMSLEITMIDLHYLNPAIKSLNLLNKVRCISLPHGMDNTFQVTKMSIDLANPDNSTYVLGTETKKNLTSVTTKVNSDLANSINNLPSENEILNRAKRDAFAILEGNDGGYVRFIKDTNDSIKEIRISDGKTDDTSLCIWVWNKSGLGCLVRPDFQTEWDFKHIKEALTNDGQIVAERITAGTLTGQTINGAIINGGVINSPSPTGKTGSVHISGGTLYVEDGTSGFATFRKSGSMTECSLGGENWACMRSNYYREFDAKYIFDAGYALKEIADSGKTTQGITIDLYVWGPQGPQRCEVTFKNGLLVSVNYK